MHPGSTATFYRVRRAAWVLAIAAPLVALGAAWWLLSNVLLAPAIPASDTPAADVVAFLTHDKGLPRLTDAERSALIQQHLRRWSADARYRSEFATAVRRSTTEERAAFRRHVFDAFKPLVLTDVRQYHAAADAQQDYLDERIVAYNRMTRALGGAGVDRAALGDALPSSADLMNLVLARTSEAERSLATAYLTALGRRIEQIVADPTLRQEFEARIAADPP
ncbi:MAG: hypothetical protein AB7Q17_02450 [Phycisphaerae bacterium]